MLGGNAASELERTQRARARVRMHECGLRCGSGLRFALLHHSVVAAHVCCSGLCCETAMGMKVVMPVAFMMLTVVAVVAALAWLLSACAARECARHAAGQQRGSTARSRASPAL